MSMKIKIILTDMILKHLMFSIQISMYSFLPGLRLDTESKPSGTSISNTRMGVKVQFRRVKIIERALSQNNLTHHKVLD